MRISKSFASCDTIFTSYPFSSANSSRGCDLREEMCDIMELLEITEECLTQRDVLFSRTNILRYISHTKSDARFKLAVVK